MKTREDKVFQALGHTLMTVLSLSAVIPVILMIISSLTDNEALLQNGYSFFPSQWSLYAYQWVFDSNGTVVMRAYGISVLLTAVGTALSLLMTTPLAYGLSKPKLPWRGALTFYVFFTMLFSGGVVSSYIMWTRIFSIKNTLWALIVPNYLVTAFNVFLVRNYYTNSIPHALVESAQIDGAGEMQIFLRIMLPLAIPTVATISLFTGLIYWNDWVNGLYYISDAKLFSLQNLLIRIMNNIQFLKVSTNMALLGTQKIDLPGSSVRMAMAMIGILPIMILFPFVQKYFIKGVVLGAVKG